MTTYEDSHVHSAHEASPLLPSSSNSEKSSWLTHTLTQVLWLHKSSEVEERLSWVVHVWDVRGNLMDIFVRKAGSGARLAPLDGVRAIAFLWVCSMHFSEYFDDWRNVNGSDCLITSGFAATTMCDLISGGENGVHIFFVLSGFLIPYIILASYRKTGSIDYFSFLYRRFLRIWPSLNGYVLVSVVMYVGGAFAKSGFETTASSLISICLVTRSSMGYWWTNLIFVTNLMSCWPAYEDICQSHLWTVSAEFQMYLFTPLLVYAYIKSEPLGFVLTAVALGTSFYLYRQNTFCSYGSTLAFPWNTAQYYCVGVLCSFSYDRSDQGRWSLLNVFRHSRPVWRGCIEAFAVLAMCYYLIYNMVNGSQSEVKLSALLLACVTGVIMRISLDPDTYFCSKLLSLDILYPLASLSYTGYLLSFIAALHTTMMFDAMGVYKVSELSTWSFSVAYVVFLLVLCGYATLLSLTIERPFMKMR